MNIYDIHHTLININEHISYTTCPVAVHVATNCVSTATNTAAALGQGRGHLELSYFGERNWLQKRLNHVKNCIQNMYIYIYVYYIYIYIILIKQAIPQVEIWFGLNMLQQTSASLAAPSGWKHYNWNRTWDLNIPPTTPKFAKHR